MGTTQQVKYYTFDFNAVTNPVPYHMKQKIQNENGEGLSVRFQYSRKNTELSPCPSSTMRSKRFILKDIL